MNVVKLGKKGQVSIPKRILESVGVEAEQLMLVDTTDDGAIVLRPANVYAVELYSEERIREFLAADEMPESLREQALARLAR